MGTVSLELLNELACSREGEVVFLAVEIYAGKERTGCISVDVAIVFCRRQKWYSLVESFYNKVTIGTPQEVPLSFA